MVSEAASERIRSRVENWIAITRQLELDVKEQLSTHSKLPFSFCIRMKVEQAYLPQDKKEVLLEALKQSGLSGI